MIETMGDMLSLVVMCLSVFAAFVIMFSISGQNTAEAKRRRRDRYYDFYESVEEEFTEDHNDPYFE